MKGIIGGYGAERVIHAPTAGRMKNRSKIGDIVEAGHDASSFAVLSPTIDICFNISSSFSQISLTKALMMELFPIAKP